MPVSSTEPLLPLPELAATSAMDGWKFTAVIELLAEIQARKILILGEMGWLLNAFRRKYQPNTVVVFAFDGCWVGFISHLSFFAVYLLFSERGER